MRKRRAVIFDDDINILELLTMFFEEMGYEVFACNEPVGCPVYTGEIACQQHSPCGDVMITDLMMPVMTGLELLELQTRQGCKLDIRNKAVLSGSLDAAALETIARLGCHHFHKPLRFAALQSWVRECEQRTDLSWALAPRRAECREGGHARAIVAVGPGGEERHTEVVNRSGPGPSARVDRRLAAGEPLDVRCSQRAPKTRGQMRWSRPGT